MEAAGVEPAQLYLNILILKAILHEKPRGAPLSFFGICAIMPSTRESRFKNRNFGGASGKTRFGAPGC